MVIGNVRHRVDAEGDVIMRDRLQQGRVRRMGDRNRHMQRDVHLIMERNRPVGGLRDNMQLDLPQLLDLGPPRRVGVIALGLFHRVEQDNGFAPMEIE